MALTIHQDAIGNKYIGYAGDVTNVATGKEISDEMVNFLSSFPNVEVRNNSSRYLWRTDGVQFTGGIQNRTQVKNSFFSVLLANSSSGIFSFNAKDVALNESQIFASFQPSSNIEARSNCVATSNGVDVGIFAWDYDSNNDVVNTIFVWAGEVKGNSNISVPQTRSGIVIINGNATQESIGVKQPDSTTERLHLDTESGASHTIDCVTDTADLFLIEDDGAGGSAGTVGRCDNLYISKNSDLVIGGFQTLNNITDGGSEQAIVVGNWGTDAKILMRVYDGVN